MWETNDTVQVGTGHDVPDQSKPGGIGSVTITGFDPSKDVIVLQQKLATDFNHLNFNEVSGNTVVTIQGDTQDHITLVGVHSSAPHSVRLTTHRCAGGQV
jgi:hypothetical protein